MLFLLRAVTMHHANICSLEKKEKKNVFQEFICLLLFFFNIIIIDSETVSTYSMNQDTKWCYTTKKNSILRLLLRKLSAPYLSGEVPQGKSPRGSPSLLFQFLAWSQYQFRDTKHLKFMIGWSTDSLRLLYYVWKPFNTKVLSVLLLKLTKVCRATCRNYNGICCDK